MKPLNQILDSALDIFFPVMCQGCLQIGSYFCIRCQNRLTVPIQRCLFCMRPSNAAKTHQECDPDNDFPLSGLLIAAEYRAESIKRLIWNFKYGGIRDMAGPLSAVLADFLLNSELDEYFTNACAVPVPLHRRRERIRGFNQSQLLAEKLASVLGMDCRRMLARTRATKRQVDLAGPERKANVDGAFSLAPQIKSFPQKILLIDDVATTGSTLLECAKTLKLANNAEIWGLVVAKNLFR